MGNWHTNQNIAERFSPVNNSNPNQINNQNTNTFDHQFESNANRDRALLNSIYLNNSGLLAHNGLYYEYDSTNGNQVTIESQKTKKTKAYKNPIMLKRNTLKLIKDGIDEDIYYLSFDYISTNKFNIKIFFNACENNTTNKMNPDDNIKETNIPDEVYILRDELIIKEDLEETNNYMNSNIKKSHFKNILPSKQLINKTLIFESISAGEKEFFDKSAKIDMKFFEDLKIFDILYNDLVIELEALKENGSVECNLISTFKIIPEIIKRGYKIKPENQKLIVKNIWFEMHDVYGFNSDSNSSECEICYTNKRNTIFLPCKHSYSCDQCANKICMKLNKCPICRLPITDSLVIENENKLNGSHANLSDQK